MNWTDCQDRRKLGESGYKRMNESGIWKKRGKTSCRDPASEGTESVFIVPSKYGLLSGVIKNNTKPWFLRN